MTDADRLAEIRTMAMWLRGLSEMGGKGVVDNIDARALGRCADMLDAATSGPSAPRRIPVEGYQLPDGTSVVTKWADAPSPTAPSGERVEAVARAMCGLRYQSQQFVDAHWREWSHDARTVIAALGTGEERVLAAPCAIDFCHYSMLVDADAVIFKSRRGQLFDDADHRASDAALARHASRQAGSDERNE